jgi:flagellar hook-basal body complex protein FliE
MSSSVGLYNNLGKRVVKDLEALTQELNLEQSGKTSQQETTKGQKSFVDFLKEGVTEVNNLQVSADAKATDLATGKSENLHETMLAMSQAELSFNFMVQVRNKALDAYNQIMNMPV